MEIIEWIQGRVLPTGENFAALGTFDGVHRGHRAVIARMLAAANGNGRRMVITFEPYPRSLTQPEASPGRLTSFAAKVELLAEMGIDTVVCIPFTPELAAMSPVQFVREVLVRDLRLSYVAVGFNYRFGHRGSGDAATLTALGAEDGLAVEVCPPVTAGGEVVSSTAIRGALQAGRVADAARLLGYWPRLGGVVVAGYKRGRTLGFPTANLAVDPEMIRPAAGVYTVLIRRPGGARYGGIANLGYSPTFRDPATAGIRLEVHIFDFSGDLYGVELTLDFLSWIRPETTFASREELIAQLGRDRTAARETLQSLIGPEGVLYPAPPE